MGTIGLSFGSPSSGQGIDVASTVTQMVAQLQGAEKPYKNQLTTLQSQDTVISNLGSLLSTLSSDITALTDPLGVLSGKLGSSSDTNTLTLLSASTTATAGSHTVTVQQLAQTSTEASSAVAANHTLSGSFSFHIGSGSSQTVSVDPANNTIAGLAATINQAGLGITASVVTDSSGSRLSLISQTSGAAGQINIDGNSLSGSASGTVSLIAGQPGQDAQFTVDGIQTSSASNTVTGAISGVTMQLLGVSSSPTTPVQVQIDNDTASVTSSLSTLVKDYNAVVSALSAQEGKDASGNAEPLFGSPIISQLQQTLSGALTTPSGTSLTSPTQIGLSLNASGTLSLDTDQLTTALNDNFTGVQTLFQNTSSFGLNLEQAVNNAGTGSTSSILSQAQKANSTAESSLNSTISTMDARIATQQTNLTAELNAANQTLQEIPMQLNMVNEIYSAITGYNQKGS
ncbi:MAG TPA: flagellar filament capping protein FliD [Acidobacteriaceae bacterium]